MLPASFLPPDISTNGVNMAVSDSLPIGKSTEQLLLSMLAQQSSQATKERAELSRNFNESLLGLRKELRFLLLCGMIIILAKDGILTAIKLGGFSVETMSSQTPVAIEPEVAH